MFNPKAIAFLKRVWVVVFIYRYDLGISYSIDLRLGDTKDEATYMPGRIVGVTMEITAFNLWASLASLLTNNGVAAEEADDVQR